MKKLVALFVIVFSCTLLSVAQPVLARMYYANTQRSDGSYLSVNIPSNVSIREEHYGSTTELLITGPRQGDVLQIVVCPLMTVGQLEKFLRETAAQNRVQGIKIAYPSEYGVGLTGHTSDGMYVLYSGVVMPRYTELHMFRSTHIDISSTLLDISATIDWRWR